MSILHDLLALGRGRPRDPDPDPGFVRRKNRTVLKAALQGLTTPFKNYVNYAAFPDRIPQTADAEPHDQVIRRAVHYVNAQLGIQGLVRTDFDRELNDRLARNAIYALCERATIDYFGTAEWDVTNEKGDSQKGAVKWLRRPNPHQTMNMVLKEAVRDTIRYDAGVIVSSLRADGHLGELRAFHGPDFWIEVDRDWTALDGIGSQYYGPWSHGLVKRYWQHSRPGIYIPFEPEEITYLQLYPRTDSMYGTDFLSRVRWQLEYLIDSTKSAGMTYANGIAPGAIWKHPDYTSIEELAERELDIELNHLGPENFGGIIHLIGNESIESYSPTLHDMEWIEGQRFFTEIVLAMFGFSSSEFFQGDVNRATAYIGRNITKSRMLYPLQIHFQNMITAKILPLMEGWEDDWEFKFLDTVDLDDELKRAQINQTKASTASSYAMLGLSVEAALELAEVDDDLRTAVKEELDDLKEQEGSWTDGIPDALPPEEAEQYYGDAGGEDYQGTAVDGDDAENQEDEEDVQKADRVYLNQGEEPPKGIQVKVGPRGGRYYTSETGRQETPARGPSRAKAAAVDHFLEAKIRHLEETGKIGGAMDHHNVATKEALSQKMRKYVEETLSLEGEVVFEGVTDEDVKVFEQLMEENRSSPYYRAAIERFGSPGHCFVKSSGAISGTGGGAYYDTEGDMIFFVKGRRVETITPYSEEARPRIGASSSMTGFERHEYGHYLFHRHLSGEQKEAFKTLIEDQDPAAIKEDFSLYAGHWVTRHGFQDAALDECFAEAFGIATDPTYKPGNFAPWVNEMVDWVRTLIGNPDVQKAGRVYLRPGEKPPAGVQVKTGPRGGRYYTASGGTSSSRDPESRAGSDKPSSAPPKVALKPIAPPERPWEMKIPDIVPWKEGEREQFARALLSKDDDALEPFAAYEGRAIGPGIRYPPVPGRDPPAALDPEWVLGRAAPRAPLRLMGWDTYQTVRKKMYALKPKPLITPEVDRRINLRGARRYDHQREMGRLHGEEREVATLFDRDGNRIYEVVGDSHSVRFTKEEIRLMGDPDGRILTHTHPSGNSFSDKDLQTACFAGLSEIRAIGGEYEYIFLPREGVGQFTEGMWYNEFAGSVARNDAELHSEFWGKIGRGEITIEEANREHHHILWTRVAKATRLRYIRRPRDPEQWTDEHQIHVQTKEVSTDDE